MTRANTKECVVKSVIVGNCRKKLLLNDKVLRVKFLENISLVFTHFLNRWFTNPNHPQPDLCPTTHASGTQRRI